MRPQGNYSAPGKQVQPPYQWSLERPMQADPMAIFQLPSTGGNGRGVPPYSAQNMTFSSFPHQTLPGPSGRFMPPNNTEIDHRAQQAAKQRERFEKMGGKPVPLNAEAMIASILDAPNNSSQSTTPQQKEWFTMDGNLVPPTYLQWLAICGGGDFPNTEAVYSLLLTSGLAKEVLGQIWALVNRTYPRQLTKTEFYLALVLVAQAQNGSSPSIPMGLKEKDYPIPRLLPMPSSPVLRPEPPKEESNSSGSSKEPSIHSLDLPRSNSPQNSESENKTIPWLNDDSSLVDKYAVFKEVEKSDGQNEQTRVWMRCFESCREVYRKACDIFKGASSSGVCHEALATAPGTVYIQGLTEIHRVIARIRFSLKTTTFQTERLVDIQSEIDELWDLLQNYASGSSSIKEWKQREMVLSEREETACGVCLLTVDKDGEVLCLTYAGRPYHAPCANFWLNCVDSLLPALPLPSLL